MIIVGNYYENRQAGTGMEFSYDNGTKNVIWMVWERLFFCRARVDLE